jgi:hypothetical protein
MLAMSFAMYAGANIGASVPLGLGVGSVLGHVGTLAILQPRKEKKRTFATETYRVSTVSEDGQRGIFGTFPISRDRLKILAMGLMEGRSFTEAVWLGTYTRREFTMIREEMVARGWARWRNPLYPQRGLELTKAGEAWLRYLANDTQPPPVGV